MAEQKACRLFVPSPPEATSAARAILQGGDQVVLGLPAPAAHLLSKGPPAVCSWCSSPETCRVPFQLKNLNSVSTPLTLRTLLPGACGHWLLAPWKMVCRKRRAGASRYHSPRHGASHLSAKQEGMGSLSLLGSFCYFWELCFSPTQRWAGAV